jgi:ketosteroid isomerase-like protein
MSNGNVELIRSAYEAYSRGDVATMLQFVDPDLEWRYLDPSLEEVAAHGDRVMVVVRTPGVDAYRLRKADDRNYAVFTVREGRIVALRDCRDRGEAMAAAAIR